MVQGVRGLVEIDVDAGIDREQDAMDLAWVRGRSLAWVYRDEFCKL